jgi:hypothetical protein
MAGNMLDVFKGGGYDLASLTDTINKLPHKPMRLNDMGLFTEEGIDTLTVNIEEKDGSLALVPVKERGAPGTPVVDDKRVLRALNVPHLPQRGAVMADEVQGVRAFGSETERDVVDAKVNRELQRMKDKLDVTIEWMKIGALKGLILKIDDAGNVSTLYDLFTQFGVAQQTFNMELSDEDTDVADQVRKITRLIEGELGAATYQRIYAFCGADFIDALIQHPSVKQFVVNWQAAQQFLQDDLRYAVVKVGNVLFEEYRGRVNGTDYIEADEAHFFPIGVPDMWRLYYAPANYVETVNTIGLPYYAKQKMMDFEVGVEFQSQSNPLPINKRPRAVIKVGLDNAS